MTAEPFPLDPREAVFTVLEAWSSDELVKRLEGRFRLQRGEPLERAEVYLDTPDWRLHRARLALARHVQGRTQELLLSDGDGDAARAPATRRIDFAWELPQGGLRKAVRKAASVRRLLVQAETEVVILPLEVLDDREKTVVRLDVTSARVRGPKETLPLRTTIRVKPLRGYAGERDAVVEFLAGDPALALDAPTKLAAALDALGKDPAAERLPWRVELVPTAPAGEELRRALGRLMEIMRRNEAGVLADLDTEFLHDFRVAVRRTRSLLSQAKRVFPADELEHFRGEFSWLGKCTSPVRDLDVFLLAAHGRAGSLAGMRPEGLEPLQRLLARRRRAAFKRLHEVLTGSRYHYAMESWAAFLEVPSVDDREGAQLPIREFAAARIRRQHRRVLKRGRRVREDSPASELHDLRIECKKLRYLVDAFGGMYPLQAGARLVKRLKRLQGALGDFNDAEVQGEMLLGFAGELGKSSGKTPVDLLVELGRAVERVSLTRAALRSKIEKRMAGFARDQDAEALEELLDGAGL